MAQQADVDLLALRTQLAAAEARVAAAEREADALRVFIRNADPERARKADAAAASAAAAAACSLESRAICLTRGLSQPEIEQLGVLSWPTWSAPIGVFPWSYGETETCFITAGAVTITPKIGGPPIHLVAGDLATFPFGLQCEWNVTTPLTKRYKLECDDMGCNDAVW